MSSWLSENWVAVVAVIAGIICCVSAGLIALIPDPERPSRFLPIYFLALTMFLFGLSLILWCESVHQWPESLGIINSALMPESSHSTFS
jgi:hypothetical protein